MLIRRSRLFFNVSPIFPTEPVALSLSRSLSLPNQIGFGMELGRFDLGYCGHSLVGIIRTRSSSSSFFSSYSLFLFLFLFLFLSLSTLVSNLEQQQTVLFPLVQRRVASSSVNMSSFCQKNLFLTDTVQLKYFQKRLTTVRIASSLGR
jgi:hypothetical protein